MSHLGHWPGLLFVLLSSAALALPTGLPGWVVSAICYALFIVPVYLLHRRFSFSSSAPHKQALPRYVAVRRGRRIRFTASATGPREEERGPWLHRPGF